MPALLILSEHNREKCVIGINRTGICSTVIESFWNHINIALMHTVVQALESVHLYSVQLQSITAFELGCVSY